MKTAQIRVRNVRSDDVPRIIEIERSWQHLSHWSVDSYYRLLSDGGLTSSFVAELEEEDGAVALVGFVIFHVAGDTSEIYNIAVERDHARCGVGKYLMAATIEASRKQRAKRVILEVRQSNTAAISFYRAFHFRIIGERKNYYSNPPEDAFVMELGCGEGD